MKDKKAFTLAETMIVLVILGVVAAITIPALVRNQIEAQNRTRIKKAMTVYDTAINKMVVENNLKSNDALYSSNPNDNTAFAPQDNCTRSSAYFKILRTLNDDNGTNCRFCSSDNVCWDISNILKPIIGIGEEGITNENSNNRYRMFAHFGDNGELRVDDVEYEQNHDYLTDDEKEELVALYNFANNKKENVEDEPFDWDKSFNDKLKNSEPCPNNIHMPGGSANSGCYNGHLLYSGSACGPRAGLGCHMLYQMQENENGDIIRIFFGSDICFLNQNGEVVGKTINGEYTNTTDGCTSTISKECYKYENWEDADRGYPYTDVPCP